MLDWSKIKLVGNYPDSAGYRKDDCSKEAASKINPRLKILQKRVLSMLTEQEGGASAEVLACILSMPPQTVKSRLTELKLMGLVRKSGRKGKTELGGVCNIWEITPCNLTEKDYN